MRITEAKRIGEFVWAKLDARGLPEDEEFYIISKTELEGIRKAAVRDFLYKAEEDLAR